MENSTEIINKPHRHESVLLGVSTRGWITIIVTLTICLMSFMQREVKEPMYSIAIAVIAYYFGQKDKPKA